MPYKTRRDDWWLHTKLERLSFHDFTASHFLVPLRQIEPQSWTHQCRRSALVGGTRPGWCFCGSGESRWSDTISLVRIEHVFIWLQMKILNEQFNSICYHNILLCTSHTFLGTCKCTHDTSWYILYAQLRKNARFALHFKFSHLGEGLQFYPVLFNPNVWPGWFGLRDAQQFQQGFVLRR